MIGIIGYITLPIISLNQHYCANVGGQPRYIIDNNVDFHKSQVTRQKTKELREKTMDRMQHKQVVENILKMVLSKESHRCKTIAFL